MAARITIIQIKDQGNHTGLPLQKFMEWLTPITSLYAAAVSVPLLLLMYFLKLKRREQIVSSTLLWKRAVQDLQVNAPFQRLRRNILLLLQLLVLLAILLALAGPIL